MLRLFLACVQRGDVALVRLLGITAGEPSWPTKPPILNLNHTPT